MYKSVVTVYNTCDQADVSGFSIFIKYRLTHVP